MRVLAVTPQHRYIKRCADSWDDAKRELLSSRPDVGLDHIIISGDDYHLDAYDAITHKYQRARTIFLAGDWDIFIALEDDMIIPPDGFLKLIALYEAGADVGYSLCISRREGHHWNIFNTPIGYGGGFSLSRDPDLARSYYGKRLPVFGGGLVFTMIRRRVLAKIPFRRGGKACNDWYLALDAYDAGFKQVADLSNICGHVDGDIVLWPDKSETLYYSEAL
jgi:hypothetical protein